MFSRTTTKSIDGGFPNVSATDETGLILAYRSSFLRKATMGDEYPTTLFEGELLSGVIQY